MNVSGERILIFGDSLTHHGADNDVEQWVVDEGSARASGQPGDLLASLLMEAGAQAVMIDANVGRSAINFWQQTSSHQFNPAMTLLQADQDFKPTKVIVFLGTNDLGNDPLTDVAAFAQLKSTFDSWGAESIAIGPPIFADDNLNQQANVVYDTLGRVFGSGNVIDARPLSSTQGRAGDGVHFQPQSAATFAAALLPAVQSAGGLSLFGKILVGALIFGGLYYLWHRSRKEKSHLTRELHKLGAVSDDEWWASLPTKKRRRQFGETY